VIVERRALSEAQVRRLLGLETRFEVHALLGTAGHTSGTISFIQAVHLPDPAARQLAFGVQVVDSAGNHSNTLQGQVNIP
jgi:hypothetical protein